MWTAFVTWIWLSPSALSQPDRSSSYTFPSLGTCPFLEGRHIHNLSLEKQATDSITKTGEASLRHDRRSMHHHRAHHQRRLPFCLVTDRYFLFLSQLQAEILLLLCVYNSHSIIYYPTARIVHNLISERCGTFFLPLRAMLWRRQATSTLF